MEKYKNYMIIAIIVMIIPFIYKMTIKHHEVKYKIGKYQINELFQITNKKHSYQFIITKGKDKYSYSINNNAHKRKKIIKEIKEYKEENIKCIIPIYKNNEELEIYCLKDNIQTSNYYLQEDENYQKILKQGKKYYNKKITTYNTKKEYKKISYYPKNIPKEYTILIWDYKGMIGINSKETFYKKFLDYDLYDNIMATTTSRYFVLFENTSVNGIEKIHYYDLIKKKYKVMTLKNKISKDSYINGVINDLIYVTDKKQKKQYTINIKKEKIEEVGNEENQFIKYENGKDQFMNISDFFEKNQYFNNERITNEKITKSTDLVQEGIFYYYREDDSFYRKMNNNNKILLFVEPNIESWSVQKEDMILQREDTLYLYNNQIGLQKLLEYNEIKYNSNTIYYVWK